MGWGGVGGMHQEAGQSLTEREKKVFRNQFSQKSPRALHVLNHGWWRLAVGGGWQLATGGGWRRLVVGGWWRLAVGGWSPLAVGGGWWLAVGGGWWSLGAVLSKKKKISSLKDRPARRKYETPHKTELEIQGGLRERENNCLWWM